MDTPSPRQELQREELLQLCPLLPALHRVLQPSSQTNPTTVCPHPEKLRVALQCLALTSRSEGRQILSRRRCVKIRFAARVKLCTALSRLSPAFESRLLLQMLPLIGPSTLELPELRHLSGQWILPRSPSPKHIPCTSPLLALPPALLWSSGCVVLPAWPPLSFPIFTVQQEMVFKNANQNPKR